MTPNDSRGLATAEYVPERAGSPASSVTELTVVQPEEALKVITETYAPSRLEALGRPGDFKFQMRVVRIPGLAFGRVRFSTDVRVTSLPPSCYVLCLASSGSLEMTTDRSTQVVSGSRGVIMYPYEPTYFENWTPGTDMITVRIDTDLLERQVVQLTGRPMHEPMRFRPDINLAADESASVARALELMRVELTQADSIARNPRGAAMLAELVATSLILSQPSNFSGLVHAPVKACPPGALRDAQDIIEDDPLSISTVGDLAARVHCSVRSLEEGFKKHLETTPMAYLRTVRLDRARQALVLSSPATDTVAHIAEQWGFRHLGRFASIYRAAYGQLPGETLKSS